MQELGPPPVHDPAPGPDDLATTADMASRARKAMSTLSPEQRSALELAYFGGRTTAEVAALEGIPQGTAKTRIHAALLTPLSVPRRNSFPPSAFRRAW